jgi:glycosyltransferase involved in cell wall biosynthesis
VPTLRVGIDGRAFTSPAPGIRRYVCGLVGGLLALGEDLDIVALGGRDAGALPVGVGFVEEPPHPPSNLGWTVVGLPRAAAAARVSVVHAPAYTAPFWAGAPVVLTIHDISYELHPEWYPYRRDWLRRAFYRRSARAASHILTVSQFSASEICSAYAIAAERVTVTPLGVDPAFAPVDPEVAGDLPTGVTKPFLLHVGDLHERRNLAMLVDALIEARRHFGATAALSLVLVGSDRGVADGLCRIAREADVPEAIVLLGDVSEDRLRALYQCATALVYPSMYEGFGLPLIEAMASGTPVIASSAASIPEVVGDAAVMLDPIDVRGWTDVIIRVVNDETLRHRLRAAGLKRASQFTWRRTAELTLDVYRRVA